MENKTVFISMYSKEEGFLCCKNNVKIGFFGVHSLSQLNESKKIHMGSLVIHQLDEQDDHSLRSIFHYRKQIMKMLDVAFVKVTIDGDVMSYEIIFDRFYEEDME